MSLQLSPGPAKNTFLFGRLANLQFPFWGFAVQMRKEILYFQNALGVSRDHCCTLTSIALKHNGRLWQNKHFLNNIESRLRSSRRSIFMCGPNIINMYHLLEVTQYQMTHCHAQSKLQHG
jgi:hypothetical protein